MIKQDEVNTRYSTIPSLLTMLDYRMKKSQFVKIKCQCGHVTLIPVHEVFHVYEPIKCEKCGKLLAHTKRTNYSFEILESDFK